MLNYLLYARIAKPKSPGFFPFHRPPLSSIQRSALPPATGVIKALASGRAVAEVNTGIVGGRISPEGESPRACTIMAAPLALALYSAVILYICIHPRRDFEKSALRARVVDTYSAGRVIQECTKRAWKEYTDVCVCVCTVDKNDRWWLNAAIYSRRWCWWCMCMTGENQLT